MIVMETSTYSRSKNNLKPYHISMKEGHRSIECFPSLCSNDLKQILWTLEIWTQITSWCSSAFFSFTRYCLGYKDIKIKTYIGMSKEVQRETHYFYPIIWQKPIKDIATGNSAWTWQPIRKLIFGCSLWGRFA